MGGAEAAILEEEGLIQKEAKGGRGEEEKEGEGKILFFLLISGGGGVRGGETKILSR